MGCGAKAVKVFLIVLNIFFWLFGLGLLGVGVWIKVDPQMANVGEAINIGLDENLLDIVAWIFIGGGAFAFITGFFGCCGAIKESAALLGFYTACLIILFAAECAVAILVGIRYNDLEGKLQSDGENWIKTQYDGKSVVSKGFNYVQVEFCCCGIKNYLDYKGSEYVNSTQIVSGAYMSFACCDSTFKTGSNIDIEIKDSEKCQLEAQTLSQTMTVPKESSCSDAFRTGGCLDALKRWINEHLVALIGVGAGVAAFQIIVFAMAIYLCIRFNRDEKDY